MPAGFVADELVQTKNSDEGHSGISLNKLPLTLLTNEHVVFEECCHRQHLLCFGNRACGLAKPPPIRQNSMLQCVGELPR